MGGGQGRLVVGRACAGVEEREGPNRKPKLVKVCMALLLAYLFAVALLRRNGPSPCPHLPELFHTDTGSSWYASGSYFVSKQLQPVCTFGSCF